MALLEHPVETIDRTEWHPSELRRVLIRLSDGAEVQIGTAPNRESAITLARCVVAEIRRPTGDWPLIQDRVPRPETVVSVDVRGA